MTERRTLEEIVRGGEGQRIEFKRELPAREERVARLLAALANSGGGTIAVGVGDDGSVVGVAHPREVAKTVERIAESTLAPPPLVSAEIASSASGDVVLIRVGPRQGTPVRTVFAGGRTTYLRVNDRNVPVEGDRKALAAAAERGAESLAGRLAGLDARTRVRLERVLKDARRFTAAEYAARCNTSLRTARRDIQALTTAFLAVEVSPGTYEVPGD